MGMAASQARFLGLTARKSNVEYQVQQIYQQRTSLANESAGLYNQMMELEVPTPPSVNSFMKTVYVLDDTSGVSTENYTIANMSKTYDRNGEYLVTLQTKKSETLAKTYNYTFNSKKEELSDDNSLKTTTFSLSKINSLKSFEVNLVQGKDASGNYTVIEETFNDENKIKQLNKNQIYKLPTTTTGTGDSATTGLNTDLCSKLNGFEECYKRADGKNIAYFYQDENGVNHYLTEEDIFGKSNDNGTTYTGGLMNAESGNAIDYLSTYDYKKEVTLQVKATLEESDNGRLTSISIAKDDSYPTELSDTTFALSATTVKDEVGYEQAMNDYEYEKGLYEKAMSDINAQTKEIQAKDQSLELKIQQLDTEQNAINTEMDSVTKIIEDNIDKTFNVFG